jgi:hypothetical protein
MRKIIAAILITLTALPVYAETMYTNDRAVLRAAFVEGSAIVKTIESGTSLEVLERVERFARVRDAQGAEGWVEARLLVAAMPVPVRPQLERVQTELAKARADLAAAQTQIGQLEAKLSQAAARADAEPAKAAPAPSETAQAPSVDDDDFPWGWLVLAFAMLWLGFGAGIVWLRERHRKKLGGMYLRV